MSHNLNYYGWNFNSSQHSLINYIQYFDLTNGNGYITNGRIYTKTAQTDLDKIVPHETFAY